MEDFEGWADDFNLENTSICSVETDSPMLIGAFKDKDNKQAFIVTHYALPTEKIGNCKISFESKLHLNKC